MPLEGLQGSNTEKTSRHAVWQELMQGDTGLAMHQQKLNEQLAEVVSGDIEASTPAFKAYLRRIEYTAPSRTDDARLKSPNIAEFAERQLKVVPQTWCLVEHKWRTHDDSPTQVFLPDEPASLEYRQAKDLFVSTELFHAAVRRIVHKPEFYNEIDESPERKELYGTGTDLANLPSILLDNVITLSDVFRTTCGAASASDQLGQMRAIVNRVPEGLIDIGSREIDLNPFRLTQLELAAMAPFGAWAFFRANVPKACNGSPVVTEQGFSNDFLYFLSRGKFPASFIRHGGCPALPTSTDARLITDFGAVFVDFHERLLDYRTRS